MKRREWLFSTEAICSYLILFRRPIGKPTTVLRNEVSPTRAAAHTIYLLSTIVSPSRFLLSHFFYAVGVFSDDI